MSQQGPFSPEEPVDPYRSPVPAAMPLRSRRAWGWIAAGIAWAVFSLAAVGFVAAKALSSVGQVFAARPSVSAASGPSSGTAQPSPTDSVDSITMTAQASPLPSVAIAGKDPRPAAAAAWNAANAFYSTGDVARYCPMFGFGRDYIYTDLKECTTYTATEIAKVSLSDRRDVGDTRIEPGVMVVLADRSIAFRESDKSWPNHPDWAYDDTSIIVMHLVPHQGWRVVGYVDTTGTAPVSSGYVPPGLS